MLLSPPTSGCSIFGGLFFNNVDISLSIYMLLLLPAAERVCLPPSGNTRQINNRRRKLKPASNCVAFFGFTTTKQTVHFELLRRIIIPQISRTLTLYR